MFSKHNIVPEVADTAHAVQIVSPNIEGRFELDEQMLNSVLLEDDIKDRDVVVISIAGAFRKGKSLLLCFFLRYLYAEYVYHSTEESNWLGDENQPLLGFSWRGGSERGTTGILMWSEVFLYDYPNGDKVAIILLDTQGTFDNTARESATVFALTTMLSSVQIFNISENIQENDLRYLQIFTEYGRLGLNLADPSKKPFQRLQFLVRDWRFPYEAEFGAAGGKLLLDKQLAITDKQPPELQSIRRHIISCFSEIECFLMPHPGVEAMRNPKFDGRLADISEEFKNCLNEFVPMLVGPENLIIKEINGQKVKVRDFVEYFKSYLAIYKGDELPEPRTILHASAEANNLAAVAVAKDLYIELMTGVCGGHKPYINPPFLKELHKRFKRKAMENFSVKLKMGGEEYANVYRQQLSIDLENSFISFALYNRNKHFFRNLQTPAIFLSFASTMFLLSGCFLYVQLYSYAKFCFIVMLSTLVLFTSWAYIRYSGEMRYVGQLLEHFANFIWKHGRLVIKLTVVGTFSFIIALWYESKMGGDNARPLQIVTANDKRTYLLNENGLNSVLLQDNIKDRDLVVVSVAGAFRKGKSFLLDFFLRYLYCKYVYHCSNKWIGEDNEPLLGFSWRGGSERDTTGILMWSEVFVHDYPNGDKVAIILLDTQGAFDSQSTVRDCATVFALSTMISSVQIFNVSANVQENDLQYLQLFTEYGRLAMAESGKKPFQRLQFLVRDWSYPYEAEFGAAGGKEILKKRLAITANQPPELQSLRRHLTSCFSEIACFLMPHPGFTVTTNPKFDGRLGDMELNFIENLKDFIPMILASENLIIKEINGEKVKVRDLTQYLKSYLEIFKGNKIPEPKTILQATAEANNLAAVAAAKDLYIQLMEGICGGHKPYLNSQLLQAEHKRIKEEAIKNFSDKPKMGGEIYAGKYREQLSIDLDANVKYYLDSNENKNIFKATRTPAVYLAICIGLYMLSGIFGVLGFYTLAKFCNLFMGIALLTATLWAYIRYSGEMSDIGQHLDDFANFIWQNRHLLGKLTFVGMILLAVALHLIMR